MSDQLDQDTTKTFVCDHCGGTFPFDDEDDKEAEAEALEIWGVAGAATDPDMAIVCDDCWELMKPN